MLGTILEQLGLASSHGVLAALVALAALVIASITLLGSKKQSSAEETDLRKREELEVEKLKKSSPGLGCDLSDQDDDGVRPRLEGTFIPSSGLLWSNTKKPWPFENEYGTGSFLAMHRPTTDKDKMRSFDYPYGEHFKGRKRQWEIRAQIKLKKPIENSAMFGIELEEYVPMNAATKKFMAIAVAAMRRVAGKDLYHSPGDDPKRVAPPHEKPTFVMPLWAFDQIIVTPEGDDEPPDLTDPHFASFGTKRVDDLSAFIKELSELKLEVGPTYTFCFYGISHFLDIYKWQMLKIRPGWPIDFDLFCGAPPVSIVLYQLDKDNPDPRHLQSRKQYIFRMKFWSSEHRPSTQKIKEMLPKDETKEKQEEVQTSEKQNQGLTQSVLKGFSCCAAPKRSKDEGVQND